jgi:hypothetical protein
MKRCLKLVWEDKRNEEGSARRVLSGSISNSVMKERTSEMGRQTRVRNI